MQTNNNNVDFSTITEKQLCIINKTAKNLAPFFVFSYYDKEDIEQEIRLICLKVINEYDEEQSDLYTFLFTTARNAIMDLRRTKFGRTINVCKYNDIGECVVHTTPAECNSARLQNILNMRKRSMAEPQSLSDDKLCVSYDIENDIDKKYIFDIIDKEIPPKIRHDYLIYLDGGHQSYYKKAIVINTIRQIAEKYGFDKWRD